MEREIVCTQIRIPKVFDEEISEICKRDGVSKNSAMLLLMRLGMKVYHSDFSVNLQALGNHHSQT